MQTKERKVERMRDYIISVNSTVDLPKEWLTERNVPVIPLKYTIDGETYEDMNGLSSKMCIRDRY